jgi:hypothetical protein
LNLNDVKKTLENNKSVYFIDEEVKIIAIYQNFNLVDIKSIKNNKVFTVDIAVLEKNI